MEDLLSVSESSSDLSTKSKLEEKLETQNLNLIHRNIEDALNFHTLEQERIAKLQNQLLREADEKPKWSFESGDIK